MAAFIRCERQGKIKMYSAMQLESMTKYDPNHGWSPCDEKEKVMSLIPEELLKYKADRIAKAKEAEVIEEVQEETLDIDKIEFDDPNSIEEIKPTWTEYPESNFKKEIEKVEENKRGRKPNKK